MAVMAPGDREWRVKEERSERSPNSGLFGGRIQKLGEKNGIKEPDYI